MTKAEAKQLKKDEALKFLRKLLRPRDTIHVVCKHTARSGVYRVLDAFFFQPDGKRRIIVYRLSRRIALACGLRYDENREGVIMRGCGMDAGFWLVYVLSTQVFAGRKPYKGGPSDTCGYWLKREWL